MSEDPQRVTERFVIENEWVELVWEKGKKKTKLKSQLIDSLCAATAVSKFAHQYFRAFAVGNCAAWRLRARDSCT